MSFVNPYAYGAGGGSGATNRRPWPFAGSIRPPPLNSVVLARRYMPGGARVALSLFNTPQEAFDVPFDLVSLARGAKSATVLNTAADGQVSAVGAVSKFATASSTYKTIPFDMSPLGATIAVSFWLYWDAFSNDNAIAWEYTANANSNASSAINCNPNNSASSKFTFNVVSNVAGKIGQGAITRPSGAGWHHYVVNFNRAATSSIVSPIWQDGVSVSVTSTDSPILAASWVASSTFNFFSRNAASAFASGRIAYWNLFDGGLTDGDARLLYARPWYLLRGRVDWT